MKHACAYLSRLGVLFVLAAASTAGLRAAEDGFRSIFDGEHLAGWDGNEKFWKVEDGTITGQTTPQNPTRGNTFLIWRQGELDDFILRLDYRIVGGNSGIQYRSFENVEKWGKWVIGGYQADIEAGDRYSGICYGERYRGILADRGEKSVIGADGKREKVGSVGDSKELQSHIKKEDWNSYEIIARGFHFVHRINGQVTCELTDEQEGVRRRSGLLALQLHAGAPMKVQFRNIRVKRLPLGDRKKIVMVAGRPSHGYGAHEHNAGLLLLKKCLEENTPSVLSAVYHGGWPQDPSAFDNADSVVLFMDGGPGHPVLKHLKEIGEVMKRGAGLACIHYAVEVQKDDGGPEFLDWIGGYFETGRSVNPHWTIQHPALARNHPITRGVKPFEIRDEWYFNMRFREGMQGVTPILSAVPTEECYARPDGPHSGNPDMRSKKGQPTVLAWAATRPDGGRGFGFTGAHNHFNWKNDDFRKLVLNALVWTAGAEVPEGGVRSATPSQEDLEANQDYPKRGPRR